ncbi:hypothetical protein [Streptomyces sp. NPDC005805]|uniref:hypothetical protein n=1 Tax=Streptomyces sp. NPDC005805 TaxID=3157068 RepID=UPI0034056C3B
MHRHARRLPAAAATALAAALLALTAAAGARAAPASDPGPTTATTTSAAAEPPLPAVIDGGAWRSGHLQGTAVDRDGGFVYFSFTNMLVKTDLDGRVLGSVTGFTGHLGDVDVNPDDGRVYGSLEYKSANAFHIAIVDGARIDRLGLDAGTSGVVTTVHLQEVAEDYTADMDGDGVFDGNTARTADHRYGCSGIDGLALGPAFGRRDGPLRLTVAYGVYANADRRDNDHQVLLQYDIGAWRALERPPPESAPHLSGPEEPDGKFFVYTGNTTYGVQNLEYDAHRGDWLMAVYKGTKPAFPNHSLYVVDGTAPPVRGPLRGQPRPETGLLLPLRTEGLHHEATGVYGWESPGQYGLTSLDDGRFYLAEASKTDDGGVLKESGRTVLHRWTGTVPTPFARVTGP